MSYTVHFVVCQADSLFQTPGWHVRRVQVVSRLWLAHQSTGLTAFDRNFGPVTLLLQLLLLEAPDYSVINPNHAACIQVGLLLCTVLKSALFFKGKSLRKNSYTPGPTMCLICSPRKLHSQSSYVCMSTTQNSNHNDCAELVHVVQFRRLTKPRHCWARLCGTPFIILPLTLRLVVATTQD